MGALSLSRVIRVLESGAAISSVILLMRNILQRKAQPNKTVSAVIRYLERIIALGAIAYVLKHIYQLRRHKALPATATNAVVEHKALDAAIRTVVEGNLVDKLPSIGQQGMQSEAVDKVLESAKQLHYAHQAGYQTGDIYSDNETNEVRQSGLVHFLYTNTAAPATFPGLRLFETELLRVTLKILQGDGCCGVICAGQVESYMLALRAYKTEALKRNPEIHPEIVIPITAHPDWTRAAEMLSYVVKRISCDEDNRVNIEELIKVTTTNTVVVIASAPTFTHGMIDPISEMAVICTQKAIALHVDATMGGFILPFLRQQHLLQEKRSFDFSVPGVSSISVDFHRYGGSPVGVSALLYRRPELRREQYFHSLDWIGGPYCSSILNNARSGALIAAAYSQLLKLGNEGLALQAAKCQNALKTLVAGIRDIKNMRLLSAPDACVVSFACTNYSTHWMAERLSQRGWQIQPLYDPEGAQFDIGVRSVLKVNKFLLELTVVNDECLASLEQAPNHSKLNPHEMHYMLDIVMDSYHDMKRSPGTEKPGDGKKVKRKN